jgi:DnaK suppressor protein
MEQAMATGGQAETLTVEQRGILEQRLVEERRRALRQMGQFDEQLGVAGKDDDGDVSSLPFHMADQATTTNSLEQNFLFASREGRLIWQIDRALRRLYTTPESFGICDDCGAAIPFERMEALPYAASCASCKKNWEDG